MVSKREMYNSFHYIFTNMGSRSKHTAVQEQAKSRHELTQHHHHTDIWNPIAVARSRAANNPYSLLFIFLSRDHSLSCKSCFSTYNP